MTEYFDPVGRVRAVADLERHKGVWLWIVRKCPFCTKKHAHGGGHSDSDPRSLLGHHTSHCVNDAQRASYVLVDGSPKTTEEDLEIFANEGQFR